MESVDDTSYATYLSFIKQVRQQAQTEVAHLTRPDAPVLAYRVQSYPRCCCCLHVPLHWYYNDAGVQQASACAFAFGALLVHIIVYAIVGHTPLVWCALFAMYSAIVLWQLVLYNALTRNRPRTLSVRIKRHLLMDADEADDRRLPTYETYRDAMADIRARCLQEFAGVYVEQLVAQRVQTVKEVRDEPLDKILARYDS